MKSLTISLLPKNHMLFIVSKQCACSRRVHIEAHMNRVGDQLDRWNELKEVLRVQTRADFANILFDR
jgi:hypothetical protein